MNNIKAGDILLIDYKFDILAVLVKLMLKDSCNHIAYAISSSLLVENLSGGTTVRPSSIYDNKRYSVYRLRFNNMSKKEITKITTKLLYNSNKKNYFKFIVNVFSTYLFGRSLFRRGNLCFNFIGNVLAKEGYLSKKYFYTPNDFRNLHDISILKLS